MGKNIETYLVDSFTNEPFKGNPAGVCLLEEEISVVNMQLIAAELGFSETAFVNKKNINSEYPIRFFSPKMEIPLCGHATLAASKVLFEKDNNLSSIDFISIEGLILPIKSINDQIELKFPIYKTAPIDVPPKLLEALGVEQFINSEYNFETSIILIEIDKSSLLQNLSPNYDDLIKSHNTINGVLVTSKSDDHNYDFESRYFWPWSGTNEDPVTGGTHTFLADYWSKRLKKSKLKSFQCSNRTGFMEVEIMNDECVAIRGNAQIILKGELRI